MYYCAYCVMLSFRVATEYRLLAGLWYGCTKPDMSLFMKPLCKSLEKLHFNGEFENQYAEYNGHCWGKRWPWILLKEHNYYCPCS